jgi:hypothetical protein
MSKSVAALRDIILNEEVPLASRMIAAEQILTFEAPTDAAEEARRFLESIFEDAENHVATRLEALKVIRKSEARRIAQPTVSASPMTEDERVAAWRNELKGQRQTKLIEAGIWPLPKGWAADLSSPDFVAPEGDLPPRTGSLTEFVERLARARRGEAAGGPSENPPDDDAA